MGFQTPWQKIRKAVATVDVTVVGTTETVVITKTNVSTQNPNARVRLFGWCVVTPGTDATSVILTVRRGTGITGTIVGEIATQTLVAGAAQQIMLDISVEDTPGEISGASYVMTVTQAGGVANGNCLTSALETIVG